MEIEVVTSPGGIEAWLVQDRFVPAFAMHFAFEGGAAQDPESKPGLAHFLGSVLGKGRGPDGIAFESQAEALGLRQRFYVRKDAFCGELETLSESRFETARVLGAMLGQRPLEPAVVESGRRRGLASLAMFSADPRNVAANRWDAAAFAGHAYARPTLGTPGALEAIGVEDLEAYRRDVLARDSLKVVAVGAISASELGELLDEAFGELPAAASLTPVPAAPAAGGGHSLVELAVSQSAVVFGMSAMPPCHADYAAAKVLNHILGGRRMSSRLFEEIRSKRGLAYEVGSSIVAWRHACLLQGLVVTRNAMVRQVLDIVRHELRRLADGEISGADLDSAKRSLVAVQALSFEDNRQTAARLLDWALSGFGPSCLHMQKARIEAVSDYDARRVSRVLLDPKNLIVSVAGSPERQAEAS